MNQDQNYFTNPVLENIWKDRYQKNGESYTDNLHRVANFCGKNDKEKDKFYSMMLNGMFFPGGRTMSNAGICDKLTLNNCFVAPQIPDDLGGIFETVKLGAMTHQRGGGIGYDFSQLRPEGTPTSNDAIASGPVSFANVFNAQTATILQGNRRGANMGVLNVYHPDIEKFIDAKNYDAGVLNHFNLSIMVDDDFMNAALNREDVLLHWPVYDANGCIENDPAKWKVTRTVNAGELWDSIMLHAYNNGEPGIFFYDNMNRDNNLWYDESIVCSNPCAEYLAGTVFGGDMDSNQYGGACNLGSIMLQRFVLSPFTDKADYNEKALCDTVRTAVRMLDNIIDVNTFPSHIYKNYQKRYRTIGLGYTGLADMLAMLGFKYDTKVACDFTKQLTELIALTAYETSCDLAEEKGSFPGLDRDQFIQSNFIKKHCENGIYADRWCAVRDRIATTGIRNARLMSVAPTGTMSLVFGNNCSSGIEPIFSLEYIRKVRIGGQGEDNIKEVTIRDYAYNLYQSMIESGVEVVDRNQFVTAQEMTVNSHIDMLSAIAWNVDMSVSKTINVPTEYPFEDCKDIYIRCWKDGIKGCTIFRPNDLRQGVLIEKSEHENEKQEKNETDNVFQDATGLNRGDVICCDDTLVGMKRKLMTGCGSMHLMAWYDPRTNAIQEVFVGRGSSGGCEKNLTAMTRLISACLRGGIPMEYVIDQLESCGGCSAYMSRKATKHDTSPGSSCATAIAKALMEMRDSIKYEPTNCCEEMEPVNVVETAELDANQDRNNTSVCPECGSPLIMEGGCNICKSCGWSKCG